MTSPGELDEIRGLARTFEYDRYMTALLMPRASREGLVLLAAFAGELRRIPDLVTEPMIGAIRFQWWRDALEEIGQGGPVRKHEVTTPLSEVLDAPAAHLLDRLVEGVLDPPRGGRVGAGGEAIVSTARDTVRGGPLAAEELAVHHQHVGPLVRPVLDEGGRADERVDDRLALLAHRPRVADEGENLVRRRRQADEVEVKVSFPAEYGDRTARVFSLNSVEPRTDGVSQVGVHGRGLGTVHTFRNDPPDGLQMGRFLGSGRSRAGAQKEYPHGHE